MDLTKISNGILFQDDFQEKTLMWTLSPSDKGNQLVFGDKGLQMIHSEQYITYTINEPNLSEYSCIVELDHIPFNENDIAGVIVLSNTKEYAECQSYFATSPSGIGNAENYYYDIKQAIGSQLDDYVVFSVNDNEPTYATGTSSSESGGSSSSGSTSTTFKDTLYKYIKFYKLKNKYIFYASEDGTTWIEVGNVGFDTAGTIGFFLYATEDKDIIDNSHCFFKNFTIYASKYWTFNGIDNKYDFEIFNQDGNVIYRTDDFNWKHLTNRTKNTCLINTTELPMPVKNAKLRVYSKNDYSITIKEFELGDIYGGDGFEFTRNVKLYIENSLINPNELYDLGVFYRGSYYIRLNIHNNEDYAISNLTVKVCMYSEYYSGFNEIGLALYDEGQDESKLNYKKELIIDELLPTMGRTIFMKLTDKPIQDFYMTANAYRFKIIIE